MNLKVILLFGIMAIGFTQQQCYCGHKQAYDPKINQCVNPTQLIDNCEQYAYLNGQVQCARCYSDYYLYKWKSCKLATPVDNCMAYSPDDQCMVCEQYTYLKKGEKGISKCIPNPSSHEEGYVDNCQFYSNSIKNEPVCMQCEESYYLLQDGNYQKCQKYPTHQVEKGYVEGCETYVQNSTSSYPRCVLCEGKLASKQIDDKLECVKAPLSIYGCEKQLFQGNQLLCIRCQKHYFLEKQNHCTQCPYPKASFLPQQPYSDA